MSEIHGFELVKAGYPEINSHFRLFGMSKQARNCCLLKMMMKERALGVAFRLPETSNGVPHYGHSVLCGSRKISRSKNHLSNCLTGSLATFIQCFRSPINDLPYRQPERGRILQSD